MIRYLFGLSGASLINGAVGPGASRTTAAQIASYLADVRPVLDVDGNGQADALTDGLLAIRYLFGLRGTALIADAVGTGATRTTAASIEAYLPLGFQSIAFSSTAPADATVGLAPYTVVATASSGLSVTFTIDAMASGVCSVSGSTVSFTAAGTCVIDADQPGNANYGAAPRMQQSFAVSARSLTVTSLPFADSFTAAPGNALSSNWVEQAGHFSTATSTAVGQAAANVATLYGLSAGNVALQADVSLTSDGQWAGLVARYSGPLDNNEYYARLTRLAAGSFQAAIYRVQGGVATQLSVQSTAIGTATLRFEVAGPSLKLFLNNSLVAYAQDTTFTTGSVGIRTSTNATLDNFSASQISFASIVLPFADNFDVATNQQLGSSWVEQAGNYAVAGGIATGQAAVNLAVLNGLSTVDGTVSAYFGLSVINSFAGLVARYTGPGGGNTYVANVALLADGYYHASILKSTAGGALTQVGSSVTLATFSLLSFKLLGSTLTLATDGTNQVSVSDSSITTAGTLGMRVSNGVAVNDFIAN